MRLNILRATFLFSFVLHLLIASAVTPQSKVYDIRKFGAKGDGKTLSTTAISSAIDACSKDGGGIVLIPKGVFLTGTFYLKDNVRLFIEKDATLKATTDLKQYIPYVPLGDLSKYNSGGDGENANNAIDPIWNRALILGIGISNFSIEGEGVIDGCHVFDAQGEEKMRGPHAIIIAESRNFVMTGVTVNNAANYAFMAYEIENCLFSHLTFNEGWDGIHIRGGKNIVIRNSEFYTGDDAIAGGFWENFVITDCHINSSCNGIRMIMPANDLTIAHCTFQGPGKYPHRTSKELKRNNMLSAIILQPGGWGKIEGNIENIHIHDILIDTMNNPLMMVLNEGNNGDNIVVERLVAKNINFAAVSIESWKGGIYNDVVFRDIAIDYVGSSDESLKNIVIARPPADSRPLPCWGWYARNVCNLTFENVELTYNGEEVRPAFWFDNVGNVVMKNVNYQPSRNPQSMILENAGIVKVE